ncbi:IucA/IucC family protein [Kribbella flavida DSM 17836]|uniref:IucA/IucC family protein n=1 Tax=Kribbella flavida (strain DSM 17836 / JCM 10339 / NBRC 14399) TaxID=479435 RepID=D2Q4D1_KRIFD|nr:IucA/IucC family protein [Kribbella flavida]ADB32245.1 IucA/IucC family protein [Kribbella flavida DSM 17836]
MTSTTEAAVAAHLNAILRCYTREASVPVTPGRLALQAGGAEVTAEVLHASPTGLHLFTDVLVDGSAPSPEDLVRLLAADADPAEVDDLAARTAESVRNVATFLAGSEATDAAPVNAGENAGNGLGRFLAYEQALVVGHQHHPAAKSRDGLSGAELAAYSPELGGRFAVHWFEVDAELVSSDQVAGAPSLQGLDALQLMAALAGVTPAAGAALVPAHPWQAQSLLQRPRVAALVREGRVKPLGPLGAQWYPTSSLRTVYHPDLPVMLKLSLGLRITNSRRESTPTELRRGLEINRLLDAAYDAGTATAHPGFSIVRDPAWVALDEGGPTLTGLDVAVREVPADVDSYACLAGLVAPRLGGVSRLSALPGVQEDPKAWVAAYVDQVLVPMLALYAETGIGLEAHQQNTLVRLDDAGRVIGGAYRDNQGYYLATSHLKSLLAVTGERDSTLAVVDDAIVDDRLTYYLLHNQALAVVGALGVDGVADELALLDVVRERLADALPGLKAAGPDGDRLAQRWLTADELPCKANMLTRLKGIDEVVAPLDAQSVYLQIPNPLRAGLR